jgi:tetratricopeptide (TPR) repeat protein
MASMWWRSGLGAVLVIVLAAGCASTPTAEGRTALREGRPAEAADRFQQALAEDPGRLDARIGLGISKYRLGAYDEAIAALTDAVSHEPNHPGARLYLALSDLRKREDARAEEQLKALRNLPLDPRFIALVDQTLTLLQAQPVSDAGRTYIAASLDYGSDWSRELAEARQELRRAELAWDPFWARPYYYVVPCRRC